MKRIVRSKYETGADVGLAPVLCVFRLFTIYGTNMDHRFARILSDSLGDGFVCLRASSELTWGFFGDAFHVSWESAPRGGRGRKWLRAGFFGLGS